MIDDYTKMRYLKTKEPVVDGAVQAAKLPSDGKVAEATKKSQD